MSALTDLFTAMANKIRSKTGTQTTYTPSEMVSDGIDDVYDAGVASATTPITPSNSSPASMTANTGYKPTANGYAIASYSSVTPSSTQTAVSSGDIVKIGGSGVIVDTVPPTPTNITPSNASPVSLTANTAVKPTASGYAIEDYRSITPSNSSPVSLTANTIVKPLTIGQAILGYADLTPSNTDPVQLQLLPPPNQPPIYRLRASGYAIQNYSTATPSDTSPASVSSGAIVKASSAGYLYKNTHGVTLLGSITEVADTSAHTITLSASVKNYRYLLCSQVTYNDKSLIVGTSKNGTIFIDTDNYVSGFSAEGTYVTGNSGSAVFRTVTYTYMSNTSISIKQSISTSRSYYFYGIN